MKLLIAVPAEGSVPLLEFFGLLDEKQRQKLLSLFALLLQSPAAVMREPYVKHFCIERYQALYELRAKSKNLVRIIFTLTDDGVTCFSRRLSSVISGTPCRRWTAPWTV